MVLGLNFFFCKGKKNPTTSECFFKWACRHCKTRFSSGMQGLQGVGDAEVLPAVVIVAEVHGPYLTCAFALDGGSLRGLVLLSTHKEQSVPRF